MNRLLAVVLLPSLFLPVACATSVGVWPAGGHTYAMPRADLETRVNTSLADDGWFLAATGLQRTYVKAGGGGQRTVATFRFLHAEGSPGSSSFEIVGSSDHVVNWLSLGILGLSLQTSAREQIESWVRRFTAEAAAGSRG